MKLRIFKPAIGLLAIMAYHTPAFAQDAVAKPSVTDTAGPVVTITPVVTIETEPRVTVTMDNPALKAELRELKKRLKNISVVTSAQVTAAIKNVSADISTDVSGVPPRIALGFKDAAASDGYGDKQNDGNELIKNYSKSYSVDGNDALNIENRYGSVTVNTWARNEFKIDVQIKVAAGSDDAVKAMLGKINIRDYKEGSSVFFKTIIGSENNSWTGWLNGHHSVRSMEINYTVYMPEKNTLTVSNAYGATVLPDMAGKITIYSAYGSFTAKALTGPSDIKVKYGNAAIGSLGNSTLEVAYGSLSLGSADQLRADISYTSATLGRIKFSGKINLKYCGGFRITNIDKALTDLSINAAYSNVNIGLSGDENANFNVTTHFGDFDQDDHYITVTSKTPADDDRGPHFTYNYKGYLGRGNAEKNITISTSYGNVKFE